MNNSLMMKFSASLYVTANHVQTLRMVEVNHGFHLYRTAYYTMEQYGLQDELAGRPVNIRRVVDMMVQEIVTRSVAFFSPILMIQRVSEVRAFCEAMVDELLVKAAGGIPSMLIQTTYHWWMTLQDQTIHQCIPDVDVLKGCNHGFLIFGHVRQVRANRALYVSAAQFLHKQVRVVYRWGLTGPKLIFLQPT